MIYKNGKNVVLARISRRCGRQRALPSSGRCLCQLSGDPISSAMTTRAKAEPSLLHAPAQKAQLLDACAANCKVFMPLTGMSGRLRSYGSTYFGHGQQLAFVSLHDCAQGLMCARPIVDILPDACDIAQTYYARSLYGSSQAGIALGNTAGAVMQASSPQAASA
eukprot:1829298-Amphidinium_carterae.2